MSQKKFEVTIADTYTYFETIAVQAATEAEARQKAERQSEDNYDAGAVFEAFAMNGTSGEHSALEAEELLSEPTVGG